MYAIEDVELECTSCFQIFEATSLTPDNYETSPYKDWSWRCPSCDQPLIRTFDHAVVFLEVDEHPHGGRWLTGTWNGPIKSVTATAPVWIKGKNNCCPLKEDFLAASLFTMDYTPVEARVWIKGQLNYRPLTHEWQRRIDDYRARGFVIDDED